MDHVAWCRGEAEACYSRFGRSTATFVCHFTVFVTTDGRDENIVAAGTIVWVRAVVDQPLLEALCDLRR
jgi:hypothetical protein